MYAGCIDYEVRRREAGEGDRWGVGEIGLYTIVYDMFWRGVGDMGVGELSWGWMLVY